MVPVLLAHMFVFAKYSKIVDFIVTMFTPVEVVELLYVLSAYISQSLR